jgi:hypothetical protein
MPWTPEEEDAFLYGTGHPSQDLQGIIPQAKLVEVQRKAEAEAVADLGPRNRHERRRAARTARRRR